MFSGREIERGGREVGRGEREREVSEKKDKKVDFNHVFKYVTISQLMIHVTVHMTSMIVT